MKIVINSKENKKLLENFPQDPYSDITIQTQYSKLHLALAYLSIDSQFFENIEPDNDQIDLSHLAEEPLIKVLKSLYGAELIAYSVQQLFSLYEIIEVLQIEEYKILLKESLQQILVNQKDSPILNSIQMLQFCIKNNILVQQLKTFNFDTKLKILQSSKNYLQLNKLSQSTLSSLLLDFNKLKTQKGDQIINHIMENYFNRKNIRPAVYFSNQQLQPLRNIWQKFHHKITVTASFSSISDERNSTTLSNTTSNLSCVNAFEIKEPVMRIFETNIDNFLKAPMLTAKSTLFNSQNVAQNQILDYKITNLEQDLKAKDKIIKELQLQLKVLKQTKHSSQFDSDRQDGETSILVNLMKSKQNIIFDLQQIRQVQSFQALRDLNKAGRVKGKINPSKKIFMQFPK